MQASHLKLRLEPHMDFVLETVQLADDVDDVWDASKVLCRTMGAFLHVERARAVGKLMSQTSPKVAWHIFHTNAIQPDSMFHTDATAVLRRGSRINATVFGPPGMAQFIVDAGLGVWVVRPREPFEDIDRTFIDELRKKFCMDELVVGTSIAEDDLTPEMGDMHKLIDEYVDRLSRI